MKFGTIVCCAALSWALIAPAAFSQEQNAKSLIAELGRRHTAVASLNSLERLAARIVYIESIGMLSEHGDWAEEQANWPENAATTTFVYSVKNIYGRFKPELAALRRTASRSGIFSDDEHERFASLVDELELLIEESQTFYDLLAAGQTSEANLFFRDNIRAPYLGIVQGSYTIGSGV
ncbi:hypothetical protein GV827_20580, partial [Sulfitobacter sp. JBTF-M27]